MQTDTVNVVRKHTEYPIINTEWVLVNRGLSGYLDILNIEAGDDNAGNFQRCAMLNYMGVDNFYVRRKVYRHLYANAGHRCNLDPWNRVFPIFPGVNTLSGLGAPRHVWTTLYDYECFHSSVWGDAADVINVIVCSTSVWGNRVYCMDILS
jgi:hypothetical protein